MLRYKVIIEASSCHILIKKVEKGLFKGTTGHEGGGV
jgi:hypothetical protein